MISRGRRSHPAIRRKDEGVRQRGLHQDLHGRHEGLRGLQREAERASASADLSSGSRYPGSSLNLYDQLQSRLKELKIEAPVIAKIESFTGKELIRDGLT